MSCDCKRLLEEYSKKLNLDEPWTIESLIEHNEHMRSLVREMSNKQGKVLAEARARGYAEGKHWRDWDDFKSELRNMTLKEVVGFLGVYEDE